MSRTSHSLWAANSSQSDPRRAFPMSPLPALPLHSLQDTEGWKDPTGHPKSFKDMPSRGKQRHREVEHCPWPVSLAMAGDMPALKTPPREGQVSALLMGSTDEAAGAEPLDIALSVGSQSSVRQGDVRTALSGLAGAECGWKMGSAGWKSCWRTALEELLVTLSWGCWKSTRER